MKGSRPRPGRGSGGGRRWDAGAPAQVLGIGFRPPNAAGRHSGKGRNASFEPVDEPETKRRFGADNDEIDPLAMAELRPAAMSVARHRAHPLFGRSALPGAIKASTSGEAAIAQVSACSASA